MVMRSGRRDLLGKNGHDVIHHRTLQEIIDEIREYTLSMLKHSKDELKKDFQNRTKAKIGYKLQALKKFLGPRDWLMGYLTLADFELAYLVDLCEWIAYTAEIEDPFIHFPKLVEVRNRVKVLDGVKEFCKSPKENLPFFFKGMVKFN